MMALIVVLVLVILDLDRPRRGLIVVSEKNLLDLQGSMRNEVGGVARSSPAASGAGHGRRCEALTLPVRRGAALRQPQNAAPIEATKT